MNGDEYSPVELLELAGEAIVGVPSAMAHAWDQCAIHARELDLVDGVGRNWLLERNPYRIEDAA